MATVRELHRDGAHLASRWCGEVRACLERLEPESVQCIVTSPPYWGLRDYGTEPQVWGGDPACAHAWDSVRTKRGNGSGGTNGISSASYITASDDRATYSQRCSRCGAWRGEHGQEPTVQEWVANEVAIWARLRRVLRRDGVAFVNLGESYICNPAGGDGSSRFRDSRVHRDKPDVRRTCGLPPGSQSLQWQRLEIALQEDGWVVRSTVIWRKRSPKPENVGVGWRWVRCTRQVGRADRCGVDDTGGFTSAGRSGPQKASGNGAPKVRCPGCDRCNPQGGWVLQQAQWRPTHTYEVVLMLARSGSYYCNGEAMRDFGHSRHGHNAWAVQTWASDGGRKGHTATFASSLPAWCIRAGTPDAVCSACGAPHAQMVELTPLPPEDKRGWGGNAAGGYRGAGSEDANVTSWTQEPGAIKRHVLEGAMLRSGQGWRPTCGCDAPGRPAIVLDPFSGSGTTLRVALAMGRRAVGIELKPDYADLAWDRLQTETPAPARPKRQMKVTRRATQEPLRCEQLTMEMNA